MSAPAMTVARMIERDKAIHAWQAAGGDFDALVALDRQVRRWRTDFPGRPGGTPEPRAVAPGPEQARRVRWRTTSIDWELGAIHDVPEPPAPPEPADA